jgi:mono/diheme cytochrome c family protein
MRVLSWCIPPVVAVVFACSPDIMPQPDEGAEIFARSCAACHGYRAEGGKELLGGQVAPDLTRIAARNGGTFPEAQVLSQIDGYGRGKASDVMPEFGSLLEGELVPVDIDGTLTPTPRPLAALLAYLESIQTP